MISISIVQILLQRKFSNARRKLQAVNGVNAEENKEI